MHKHSVWIATIMAAAVSAIVSGCNGPAESTASGQAIQSVAGYVGGEKMELLENERVVRILADKYSIAVNPTKAGSVEMASELDLAGKDFIWPSNDFAVELFRQRNVKVSKEDIAFNSPIVIFTGWNIANALIREGVVEKKSEGFYTVRLRELVDMISAEKTWKDIGLEFHGKLVVRCTDPTRSNSGNMFAGLVANMLNKGDVVDEKTSEDVLPEVKRLFARLGMMEHSSGDIFRKFIATGINNSMVVGYENQIVEFTVANPKTRELIQNSVCVLYPEPTVWSSHPIISLNDKGNRLIDAMMDEQVQQLAWTDHGFRSGLVGVTVNPTAVSLPFMPDRIDSVIPLPGHKAMLKILNSLKSP